MHYVKTSPCSNCPYRKDATLAHWSEQEFKDLIAKDNTQMGSNYGCHRNDGHVCRGFLMDQDRRGFPSLTLRMDLIRNKVDRTYLDRLHCVSNMFKSIQQMAKANFPKIEI